MKDITTYQLSFRIRQILAFLLCLIVLTTILPLSVFAQADQSKVVRVGWFESTYNKKDAEGKRTGYSYEYQRRIAAYTGWTYEYVEGSWNELMQMLISGDIDLLSGVSYTEERSEQMLFSSYALGTQEYYLYIPIEDTEKYQEDYSYFNGRQRKKLRNIAA